MVPLRAARRSLLAIVAMLAIFAARATAQRGRGPGGETAFLAGPSPYDLNGTGTGFAASIGLATRLTRRVLIIEPSIGYFTHRTQFGRRSHWLFPELSLQAEARLGGIRPFIGGGLGFGTNSLDSPNQLKFTLHAVGGIRLSLSGDWGARAEVRGRSVDPWSGHTLDILFGVTRGVF
jgi:hypothetical protein